MKITLLLLAVIGWSSICYADHWVSLTWTASTTPDVSGYNVYRSQVSGGPYTQINGAIVTDLSYGDRTDVQAAATYYYVVTAVASDGTTESSYSNEASVQISNDPASPASLLLSENTEG